MNKHVKKLFLTLCAVLVSGNAIAYTTSGNIIEKWFKASELPDDSQWTFEFKNKEKKPAYIGIFLQGLDPVVQEGVRPLRIGASQGSQEKDHSYLRVADLDPRAEYSIVINDKPDSYERGIIDHEFIIAANPNRKQLFLTWEKKELRAQSGSYGKTQSGIVLDKNVKKTEIKRKR